MEQEIEIEEKKDATIESALEMARCVEINMGNLTSMSPALSLHPMVKIVEMQIKECITMLEKLSGE